MLEKLLKKSVDATLNSEQTIAPLVIDAVKSYLGEGEHLKIVASEKMLETLRAELASMAQDGIEIVTDKTVGTGFRVKLADGRIEHDFTGTAVVDALAKQLRPALAALLNS